jgi:hypothetical protein
MNFLEEVQEVGKRLSAITDSLNEVLAKAEKAILELGLGVTASVPLPGSPGRSLAFGKEANGWKLLVVADDGSFSQPLLNSSRKLRLEAVDRIPPLVEALFKEAKEEQATISTKIAQLSSFITTLEKL